MQDASSKIYANNATLESKISTATTNIIGKAIGIGQPIIRLSDELNSDEIRLEGAEVSRDTYASLFAIYGTTYGAGNGSTTFNLPDFRNRAVWGAEDFGYIEAELPNIKATFTARSDFNTQGSVTGAVSTTRWSSGHEGGASGGTQYNFNASKSNPIYKDDCNTVQPPAIKVRVVTRYK